MCYTHKYIQITGDKYLWADPFLWPIHANTLPGQKGCAPFIWFIKSWFKVSAYKMIFKSLYIISCIKTKEYIQVWKEVSIPNTHEKINALENKISITWYYLQTLSIYLSNSHVLSSLLLHNLIFLCKNKQTNKKHSMSQWINGKLILKFCLHICILTWIHARKYSTPLHNSQRKHCSQVEFPVYKQILNQYMLLHTV